MSAALVTGATGMLGSYIVERLVASGWKVRALARRPERAGWVEALGAEVVAGDILHPPSICRATRGSDAIFHCAAAIGSGDDWQLFRNGNVVGTQNMIEAARAVGARLVYVSSTAVFGQDRYFPTPTDEEKPLPTLPKRDVYGRSKQEAEAEVLRAHARGRIWATVVRPPVMYGKRDRQFAPRIAPILRRGVFPLIRGGRSTMSLVHASAVADGAVRAGTTQAAAGRVYHLTNDFEVTVADLVRFAAEGLGCRILTPSVPLPLARMAFKGLGLVLVAGGRGDLASHAMGTLAMLSRNNPLSSQRARRELGWAPRIRPCEGVPAAFRWWRESHEQAESRTGGGHHADA